MKKMLKKNDKKVEKRYSPCLRYFKKDNRENHAMGVS
jgi:hypothetical protein